MMGARYCWGIAILGENREKEKTKGKVPNSERGREPKESLPKGETRSRRGDGASNIFYLQRRKWQRTQRELLHEAKKRRQRANP